MKGAIILAIILAAAGGAAAQTDQQNAGNITGVGQSVCLTVAGAGSGAVQVTGTWSGTLEFQGSVDGATNGSIRVFTAAGGATATNTTANGIWLVGTAGFRRVCVAAPASFSSGTATVTIRASAGSQIGQPGGSGGGGGDATAANQVIGNTTLDNIFNSLNGGSVVSVDASQGGPVSVFELNGAGYSFLSGVTSNTTGSAQGVIQGGMILKVNCASCAGGTKVTWEGSADNGGSWKPITGRKLGDALPISSITLAQDTTTAGVTYWELSTMGLTSFRASVTNYNAGTVTVSGSGQAGRPDTVYVGNGTAATPLQVSVANTATNGNKIATDDANTQAAIANLGTPTGDDVMPLRAQVVGFRDNVDNFVIPFVSSVPVNDSLPGNWGLVTRPVLVNPGTAGSLSGSVVMGKVSAGNPSYSGGDHQPISLTNSGGVRVDVLTSGLPTGAATSGNQTSGGQKTQVVDASGNVAPAGDTAARAGFGKVTDGTNTAAVKAASTAAGATDPALVVAVSPNNSVAITAASLPLPTGAATEASLANISGTTSADFSTRPGRNVMVAGRDALLDRSLPIPITGGSFQGDIDYGVFVHNLPTGQANTSGSLTTSPSTVELSVASGSQGGLIEITGTWSGSIPIECAQQNGVAWQACTAYFVTPYGSVPTQRVTANGTYAVNAAGLSGLRLNGNTSSGTVQARIMTAPAQVAMATTNSVAGTGTAAPNLGEIVAGVDPKSTVRPIAVDAMGAMIVALANTTGLPKPTCNAVRRTNCIPKGW